MYVFPAENELYKPHVILGPITMKSRTTSFLTRKNRLISDIILVASETLCSMNNHKSSKHGYMALKLDMSKPYDRVEWSFLEITMRKLGFNERWITLIMTCVKTVSYSVLVNEEC